jgi:hypothetical protein
LAGRPEQFSGIVAGFMLFSAAFKFSGSLQDLFQLFWNNLFITFLSSVLEFSLFPVATLVRRGGC